MGILTERRAVSSLLRVVDRRARTSRIRTVEVRTRTRTSVVALAQILTATAPWRRSMAASNLPVRPSDPQRSETRRIDRLIGSLLHSLEILGAAQLRVAAELERSPLHDRPGPGRIASETSRVNTLKDHSG